MDDIVLHGEVQDHDVEDGATTVEENLQNGVAEVLHILSSDPEEEEEAIEVNGSSDEQEQSEGELEEEKNSDVEILNTHGDDLLEELDLLDCDQDIKINSNDDSKSRSSAEAEVPPSLGLTRSLLKSTNEDDGTNYDKKLHNRFRLAIHPDTKIVIGQKEFPCHLVLLQTYSKYFERIKRPPECIYRCHLPEEIIPANHFPSLMNWILLDETSKVRIINKDNVVPLFAAGHALEVPQLKEQCWNFICEAIQNNDPIILHLYEQAQSSKLKQLRYILSSKLSEMFQVLYQSGMFLSIGLEDFAVILNSDDASVESELEVFHAASRWLLHDWKVRSPNTIRIMKCVRFGLLTSLQLTQIRHCAESTDMAEYSQIFSYSEVNDMLNDGLTYAIFQENLESDPEELNKWLERSNTKPPRKRKPKHVENTEGAKLDPKSPHPGASVVSNKVTTAQFNGKNDQLNFSKVSRPICSTSSVSTNTIITPGTPTLQNTTAVPSLNIFVDEIDDGVPLLSNRKPKMATSRQSSLNDPFTLASVLRSRMRESNTLDKR